MGPRAAVWIQPVAPLALSVLLLESGQYHVQLPLGFNVALGHTRRLNAVAEATFLQGRNNDGAEGERFFYRGSLASLGASYAFPLTERVSFFLQGKALFGVVGWSLEPAEAGRAGTGVSWQLGPSLDAGLQLVWGPLYAAVVLGVGVQYCAGCDVRSTIAFPQGSSETSGSGVRAMVNPNLVRVGYAW